MVLAVISKAMTKVFGSRNERMIKRYRQRVTAIHVLEPEIRKLSDAQLRASTQALSEKVRGNALTDIEALPEAFAIMREAMDRQIGLRSAFDPSIPFDPAILGDKRALYEQIKAQCTQEHAWRTVEIPVELYDAIRAAVPVDRPPFRARPFDVQLIGGMVLYEGKIAEMATGEGKTFVAPLACFLMGLTGKHCHVVTVNDYLVKRDAAWVAPAFYALGMSVGYIQAFMDNQTRQRAYRCTVTYGTNSEFGFDFLRDNMKQSVEEQVQGPLDYAIIDEVDSILIDEARTPLIISGPAHDDSPRYKSADEVTRKLILAQLPWDKASAAVEAAKRKIKGAEGEIRNVKGDAKKIAQLQRLAEEGQKELEDAEKLLASEVQMYEIEYDRKSVHLTHEGIKLAQEYAGVGSFYIGANMDWPHLLEQSLRAHVVYERDKDYVVQNGEIVIVDEFTGRLMVGRQWSEGLHQSVEAKERVTVKPETQTMATITLQNFFKMYKRIAGMTGTALTEAEEFQKIYKLDVVKIPTNRPVVREDLEDLIFMNENAKWNQIVEHIKEVHESGRPVLVGTTSVEKSERLSNILKRRYGIEHEVLNAKNHEREAEIIAKAGQQYVNKATKNVGRVTIATNMAGRGTDIKLGPGVTEPGGLYVVGTERHEARRVDHQLRGRSGRQGDPGTSRFFLSLEDDLMKLFAGDFVLKALQRLGMKEDEAIEHRFVSKSVERAQKKVEERNFGVRKNLLEYDEVRDVQRNYFYKRRQAILEGTNLQEIIFDIITESVEDAVVKFLDPDYVPTCISEWVRMNFNTPMDPQELRHQDTTVLEHTIRDHARNEVRSNIMTSLSEFMDPDAQPEDWDYAGLSAWAKNQFGVQISVSDLKSLDRLQIGDGLVQAASQYIDKKDCSGLARFLVKNYAQQQLSEWAKNKFLLDIKPEELIGKPVEEATEFILNQARKGYQRREIEYPIEYALEFIIAQGGVDNIYASQQLSNWLNQKYAVHIPDDQLRSLPPQQLHAKLLEISSNAPKAVEKEIDDAIAKLPTREELAAWATHRFKVPFAKDEFKDDSNEKCREFLYELGHAFVRNELTHLERNVLLQIFDTTWKDHLYAMDQLRDSIGLRGIAERDPRIEYKREGSLLFLEFHKSIRDKVTDVIFRVRIQQSQTFRNVYANQKEIRQTHDSYGVGSSDAAKEVRAERQAAQGHATQETQPVAVATIVNDQPKVGRNDPCPCGSGKKYKQCCGKAA